MLLELNITAFLFLGHIRPESCMFVRRNRWEAGKANLTHTKNPSTPTAPCIAIVTNYRQACLLFFRFVFFKKNVLRFLFWALAVWRANEQRQTGRNMQFCNRNDPFYYKYWWLCWTGERSKSNSFLVFHLRTDYSGCTPSLNVAMKRQTGLLYFNPAPLKFYCVWNVSSAVTTVHFSVARVTKFKVFIHV